MNPIDRFKIFRRKIREGENFPLRKGKHGSYIFIHINKTAGTSIAKCIGLPKKRHLTVKQVIKIVGKDNYQKAYTFSVVRNPWAKVVSHYQYRVRTNQTQLKENPISFEEWVVKTYGPNKDPFYYNTPKMFMPQVEWLKDNEGIVSVDCVMKFENLPEAFDRVAKAIGVKSTLPKLNTTRSVDYRNLYNGATRKIIEQHFSEDIELFKYKY